MMSANSKALSIERLVDFTLNKIEFMSWPRDCHVVPGSTPVVSFGDFTRAKVATLGINPSSNEFMDTSSTGTSNKLLPEGKKRLADFESLGILSTDPLDDDTAEYQLGPEGAREIWEGCRDYFQGPNAYWSWFSDLEAVLNRASLSYKDSSACHLDISPWATNPVFRDLSKAQQDRLLLRESDFLEWQIAKSNIELVVINGATVYESLRTLPAFKLWEFAEIKYLSGARELTSKFISGHGPGFSRVCGWTLNLQELRVSKEEKDRVMKELSLILQESM
jgi:hypothetical protein